VSKLADRIRKSANESVRVESKIDTWLRLHPDKKKDLDEAAQSFAAVKGHSFGWRKFALVLAEELDDWPAGHQHVNIWFAKHYPEYFGDAHKQKD
jgi:hypothetical protein